MITVVHVRKEPYDVYIGRANGRAGLKHSRWANPYVIGRDGDRAEVIEKYRTWLLARPVLIARLPELRDKRLACWCKPEACHGDVLKELVEGRCFACGLSIWEHEYVVDQWQAGEDWSEHVWGLSS